MVLFISHFCTLGGVYETVHFPNRTSFSDAFGCSVSDPKNVGDFGCFPLFGVIYKNFDFLAKNFLSV